MVTVVLLNDNIRVRVPVGTTLRQIAEKTGASMEFGCREGACTTCTARVVKGMMLLNEKNMKETKALEMIGGNVSGMRLMCQSRVRCEEGEIEISYGQL